MLTAVGSFNHAMNSIVEKMQFRWLVSCHGGSGRILQSCYELNCQNNAVQVVSVMAWWIVL